MAVGRCEVVEMMRHTHSLAGSEICRRESYPIIKSRFVFTIFVPLCVAYWFCLLWCNVTDILNNERPFPGLVRYNAVLL